MLDDDDDDDKSELSKDAEVLIANAFSSTRLCGRPADCLVSSRNTISALYGSDSSCRQKGRGGAITDAAVR